MADVFSFLPALPLLKPAVVLLLRKQNLYVHPFDQPVGGWVGTTSYDQGGDPMKHVFLRQSRMFRLSISLFTDRFVSAFCTAVQVSISQMRMC